MDGQGGNNITWRYVCDVDSTPEQRRHVSTPYILVVSELGQWLSTQFVLHSPG